MTRHFLISTPSISLHLTHTSGSGLWCVRSLAPMMLYHFSGCSWSCRKYESIFIFFITHSTRSRNEFDPIATSIQVALQYSKNGIRLGSDSSPAFMRSTCVCHICDLSSCTSRCILYFSSSIEQNWASDLLPHHSLSKSLSVILKFFSWKNRNIACRKIGIVWAMTPSKSKSIADISFMYLSCFIVVSECTPYTPFWLWLVEGKTTQKKPKFKLRIPSEYNKNTRQNKAPSYTAVMEITKFFYWREVTNNWSHAPSEHIPSSKRNENASDIHRDIIVIFVIYTVLLICNPKKKSTLVVVRVINYSYAYKKYFSSSSSPGVFMGYPSGICRRKMTHSRGYFDALFLWVISSCQSRSQWGSCEV